MYREVGKAMKRYGHNIYAVDEHGRKVHVKDVPANLAERREHVYRCPECNAIMIAKKGEVSVHHFAHKPGCVCKGRIAGADWKGGWKALFPDDYKRKTLADDAGAKVMADMYFEHADGTKVIVQFKNGFTKRARFAQMVDVFTENADKVAWVFDATGNDHLKMWDGKPLADKLAKCHEGDTFSIKWPVSRPVLEYWNETENVAAKDPELYVYFHVGEGAGRGWMLEMTGRDYGAVTVCAIKAEHWLANILADKFDAEHNACEIEIIRDGVASRKLARVGAKLELPAGDRREVDDEHGLRWKTATGKYVYGAENICVVDVKRREPKYILERYDKPKAKAFEKVEIPKVVLSKRKYRKRAWY